MIASRVTEKISRMSNKYPKKTSVIPAALMLIQEENNRLTDQDIVDLSELLEVPVGEIRGVASFYSLFHLNKPIGKYHLQVDTNIPAMLMGAGEILKQVEEILGIKAGETTTDDRFTLSTVEDLASGGTCPVIRVNSTYYENMTKDKVDRLIDSLKKDVMPPNEGTHYFGTACRVLLKNRGIENSRAIETYKKSGGYKALGKARTMSSEAIVAEVRDSGIRGRGGAGFPTGVKWASVPRNAVKPVYLICNADEGEPGTFKDRQIMEYDPHMLIEGMAIAARAINAKLGFIYIRGEFGWIAEILETAIDEARTDGQLSGFDVIVHRGSGSYICGEETALIQSLEGKRGQPRKKPPFPTVEGLFACPTLVNNVETLASIPFIIEYGSDQFKQWGFADNYGFKLFALSGHVNNPGVYEYPMGVPFMELLDAAGGVKGRLKAAIVGGLSTPVLTAAELHDLTMDYDSCRRHGTSLGARGIIVMNEDASIPDLALRAADFFAHESCGQCTPCREGTNIIVSILRRIVAGHGFKRDIERIVELAGTVGDLTLCPVGMAFTASVKTMIQKFRSEFDALVT
jgi:NADH:ubiquinone oxidoreductase subunit F (NADH-binding)/NADH:ubiquinone oxidoreductase subunit E